MSGPLLPACPGLEHVPRVCHATLGVVAKVPPGYYYATRHDEHIETTLGSCVSACIRDPQLGVGGLNHFMLPVGGPGFTAGWDATSPESRNRFGNFAMDNLIASLVHLGAERSRLEVKLFGGGTAFGIATTIGSRNIGFAKEYLSARGLVVAAADLGGAFSRRVTYHPLSGRAQVRRLRRLYHSAVVDMERQYLGQLT